MKKNNLIDMQAMQKNYLTKTGDFIHFQCPKIKSCLNFWYGAYHIYPQIDKKLMSLYLFIVTINLPDVCM